jgi:hypothetical protein
MIVKKPSAWQFVTSSSGGLGVEFVAAEGGRIYFQDPDGASCYFTYGAAGVGLSAGLKLPKIGKLELKGKSIGGAIAPASFPNAGKMYILESFGGDELKRSDISGVCMLAEVGGGIVAGGSATAMLLGMNPIWLAGLVGPFTIYADSMLIQSATAVLVMAGVNVGLTAGAGAAVFLGGLF